MDTLAQSYVAATSQLAASAADAAEARKQLKYAAVEQQFIVQPIGFETMGSWGAGAKAFLSDVGSRVKQATGNPRALEFFAAAGKYRDPARQHGFSYGDSRQHQGLEQFVFIILVTLFSLILPVFLAYKLWLV